MRNSGEKSRSIGLLGARRALAGEIRAEADGAGGRLARAGVRGHDQHDLAEVGLAPGVVGERRVVHHLQQDVEEVRVRLLDLVEQHDACGLAAHGVDEQSALLEADVARRGADESRHRVLLHELAHVEAVKLAAELARQLTRQLRLADAGGAGEEKAAGRVVGVPEAGARALDGAHDGADGRLLAEDGAAERLLEPAQALLLRERHLPLRDARHAGDDALDLGDADARRGPGGRCEAQRRPGLVDHVDRAVGQALLAQVPAGQAHRHLERLGRVGDAVVLPRSAI